MDERKTEDLVQAAEAEGCQLEMRGRFVVVTLPSDPAIAEPMLQDLAANLGEVRQVLRNRADREWRRLFFGRVAFFFGLLQCGTIEGLESSDGRLAVRATTSWGSKMLTIWPPREVILISKASACPADRRGGVGLRGDKLGHLVREAQRCGARLWSEQEFVVFGWPTEDLEAVPALIYDAAAEAAEWGEAQDPPMALATEVIGDRFVSYASDSAVFRWFDFGRRSASSREISARFLQLAMHLDELTRALVTPNNAGDFDLRGERAIIAPEGAEVFIEEQSAGDEVIYVDGRGLRRRCRPESLLLVTTSEREEVLTVSEAPAPRRWGIFGAKPRPSAR
jgi:hypothetical protein